MEEKEITKIKLQMRILDFTQAELAELVGCSRLTLGNFLRGKTHLTTKYLFKLLKVLNLKISVI